MRRLYIIIILRNTQFFHKIYTMPVENYHLTVEKVKLNVYERNKEVWKSVINRGLIRSLNVIESSDLGEQSNRISQKCQESCCNVTEVLSFPDIQQFLNIILDIVSELVYNYIIVTNSFSP